MVQAEDGLRDNRWNPSKRFWGLFVAVWVALAVVSLIAQAWWTAACGIINAVMQWRNAPATRL